MSVGLIARRTNSGATYFLLVSSLPGPYNNCEWNLDFKGNNASLSSFSPCSIPLYALGYRWPLRQNEMPDRDYSLSSATINWMLPMIAVAKVRRSHQKEAHLVYV